MREAGLAVRTDTGLLSQAFGSKETRAAATCLGTLSPGSLTGVAGETAPEGKGGEGRRRTSTREEKVQCIEWRRAGK